MTQPHETEVRDRAAQGADAGRSAAPARRGVRTILACLLDAESARPLSQAGSILARRFGGHLTGLHVMEAMPVYSGAGLYVPAPIIEPYNAGQTERAAAVEAAFRAAVDGHDHATEWRLVRADWTTTDAALVESARAADLVLMARVAQGPTFRAHRALQDDVIRAAGRPVLVIPGGAVPETFGRRVLVGWSATREAARAVHDMLPLLEDDAEVTLLRIGSGGADEMTDATSNDLAAAIARHGAHVTVAHRHQGSHSVAQLLVREAVEIGADMVVTGAFGHSRAYDFVIGAATRELLAEAPLPVLYSK